MSDNPKRHSIYPDQPRKRQKSETELIVDLLAEIRDTLFDESDEVDEHGHDLSGSYAGSPYEVLGGIERKLKRQADEIRRLKAAPQVRQVLPELPKLTREELDVLLGVTPMPDVNDINDIDSNNL